MWFRPSVSNFTISFSLKLLLCFREAYDVYGADEFGTVTGVDEMKAEIYARGPIACSLNSEANAFNYYQGGVIKCDSKVDMACKSPLTDHVIVIAGWGVEESTGTP